MKKICLLLMMSLTVASGCAGNSGRIKAEQTATRTGVFEEITEGGKAPDGYSDLRISCSLKTHLAGSHSVPDSHGTPDYQLLLDIDGQGALLHGTLQKESREPASLVDTEAGDGVRYTFRKSVRLREGSHRVAVAVPHDVIVVARQITLAGGKLNDLILEPVYGSEPGMKRSAPYTARSFKGGVNSFRVLLNGEEVRGDKAPEREL